jgi:hypothetical protein
VVNATFLEKVVHHLNDGVNDCLAGATPSKLWEFLSEKTAYSTDNR